MCLSPISVINPSKYVSLKYRDPYLMQVPCGHCAECQTQLSNQWLYRTFQEIDDVFAADKDNFVMFDTLTYDNEHLPMMSNFIDCTSDYPCFSKKDIQDFFKRLRIDLDRSIYNGVQLRYFLSSEYGALEGKNRPHYHILLFVYRNGTGITPLQLSSFVSDAWRNGRTDGFPFKSSLYIYQHNVISNGDLSQKLRTSQYVCKYVQKSCVFQEELNKRVNQNLFGLANRYCSDNPDEWLESLAAYRIKRKLKSLTNQFHMQSLFFGESALRNIDIDEVFNTGVLFMPSSKNVKIPVLLPTYYKRKLFYRLVEIDGAKSWQLTDYGMSYKKASIARQCRDLEGRLECVSIEHHLGYDCHRLAEYICYDRGRIKGEYDSVLIEEKLNNIDFYNYSTIYDRDNFGESGLVLDYLGNSSVGYFVDVMPPKISIHDFISQYVILDEDLESQLSMIYYYLSVIDKGKQDAFKLKQILTNKYKCFISGAS